ncbi:hypothetical protein FPANT_1927 [Fusarium pseudoanthophilum]|uniref:Fucose-specific lectin n=1 Tax=Fusarium pseudoanthophilum TaxID=48495 RepID=A0A8H5UXC2_9HYPO|nr:hypothetical protein FPANT_1927 [Fusarium pseudoanthophilum]
MPSCAATFDADGNDTTKIHVFYNEELNKNLGLLFRNERDGGQAQYNNFSSGEDAVPGSIIKKSYLAATKFNNQDFVFAVTDKKSVSANQSGHTDKNGCKCPPDAKEVDLSLVSPVYKIFSPSVYSDNYRIAACSSKTDNWIYYLKKKDNDLNLYEATIGNGSDNEYTELTKLAPNSALAAWYGTVDEKRHIVYQSTAGPNNLYEFTADSPNDSLFFSPLIEDNRQIDQAAAAKSNTSVAVTVTQNGVYLYYINTNKRVSRVSKSLDEKAEFANYTVVKSCTNNAADDAQLTVTLAGDDIHIFYTAENQNKQNVVSHFVDKNPPKPAQ